MPVRPRPMFGTLFAVVVLAVAACGGSGSTTQTSTAAPTAAGGGQATSAPAGGGGAVDAGTILTSDVAVSIIGGTVTKLPIPSVNAMSIVAYSNTSGGSVTAIVESVPAGTGTALMQAAVQAAGAKGELQTLGGIGDAAGKVVNANDATVVFVKGNTLVVVYAQSDASSGSDLEAKLESVARQIEGTI